MAGGGLNYETLATSSSNKTYSQELAELKPVLSALSENAKMRTVLQWYSQILPISNTSGIFTGINGHQICYIFDVSTGKAYTRDLSNGTLQDISNNTTSTFIRLFILKYEP